MPVSIALVNSSKIFFKGKYRFLDNGYKSPITVWGREFASAEEAYKWKRENTVIHYGTNDDVLNEFVGMMSTVLTAKFVDTPLGKRLCKTGSKQLIYVKKDDIFFYDEFWGVNNLGEGRNQLGEMLMALRHIIQKM